MKSPNLVSRSIGFIPSLVRNLLIDNLTDRQAKFLNVFTSNTLLKNIKTNYYKHKLSHWECWDSLYIKEINMYLYLLYTFINKKLGLQYLFIVSYCICRPWAKLLKEISKMKENTEKAIYKKARRGRKRNMWTNTQWSQNILDTHWYIFRVYTTPIII